MNTEKIPPSFVHLHLNTNFSFNHGLIVADEVAEFCGKSGMQACACTDHGNLAGAMCFQRAMEVQNIKPIFGCEFLIGDWEDNSPYTPHPHRGMTLVCLAETLEGYRNLCRLTSRIALGECGSVSHISKDILKKYHNGLIALSGGPSGEISRKCLQNNPQAVDDVIAEYLEIFGRGNFFLELQDHGLAEEQTINRELAAAARRNNIPLVATNDVHYLAKEQARAYEFLLKLSAKLAPPDIAYTQLPGEAEYDMKTPEEMEKLFHWCPEALQNTVVIANRCTVHIPNGVEETSARHRPLFPLPTEFQGNHDDYLRKICKAGLYRRYGIDADASSHTAEEQKIIKRMEQELSFIFSSSLSSDFLVVWDLLWDKELNDWRWYNIGHGAICGSLVAYLMPLIDIDPLKHNLLFERFLNEERTVCLNINIEEWFIRGDVVFQEACKRYGAGYVAKRLAVKKMDSKRIALYVAYELGYENPDRLSALVGEYMTAKLAAGNSSKLRNLLKRNALARECVEITTILEQKILDVRGNKEIISSDNIIISDMNFSEACMATNCLKYKSSTPVCHLDLGEAQQRGMMEIGCWEMNHIAWYALSFQKHNQKEYQEIPDNAPEAFSLLAKDDDRFYVAEYDNYDPNWYDCLKTEMIAYLRKTHAAEYDAFGHFLGKIKPNNFEELTALYALWCPGPLQYLDTYLHRRSGEEPVVYAIPELEPILKETYGIILYQEQFMQIVQLITGLSLGKADCLRRSMGPRKVKLPISKEEFFDAGKQRGIGDKALGSIWEQLFCCAPYCYLKSQAVARATLLYRVAYINAPLAQT